MAMNLLVAYDISDDARRLRIANTLSRHGLRVQRSVFDLETRLDIDRFREVIEGAQRGPRRAVRLCIDPASLRSMPIQPAGHRIRRGVGARRAVLDHLTPQVKWASAACLSTQPDCEPAEMR